MVEGSQLLKIRQSQYENTKPDKCLGGCMEVHTGIKLLGFWSLIQSIGVMIVSIRMMNVGQWWGVHLALFNFVYLMQSYWYWKWFKNDDLDTRQNLLKGYKYVLIQGICLYSFMFLVVYNLPAHYLPDKYEDQMGNEYEFPPE